MFIRLWFSRKTISAVGILLILAVGYLADRWLVAVTTAATPQPTERVVTERKVIALTINVDWGEDNIPDLLKELDKANALVTFFVTGRWAKNHPDLLKTMASYGHEIENHGYSHPHPDRLSVEQNKEEIKKTESIILGITGYQTHYYAPPYGEKGPSGLLAADQLGYQTILWTLDTIDWRADSSTELIVKRILYPDVRFGLRPEHKGAIVLMHPKENSVLALPIILQELTGQGFEFVTIDKLITLDLSGNTTS